LFKAWTLIDRFRVQYDNREDEEAPGHGRDIVADAAAVDERER